MMPSGTLRSSISVMRAACSSSLSTPSASDILRIDPNKLMATGYALFEPSGMTAFSNSSASPPFGIFMTRSAISHNSKSILTGAVILRSSPIESIAAMNSASVFSGIEQQGERGAWNA